MKTDSLTEFYDNDADRFWDPRMGMVGRDLAIYPLLKNFSGSVLEYGAGSGSLLLSLATEDRFSSLIGVDISKAALRKISKAWGDICHAHGKSYSKLTLTVPSDDTLPMVPTNTIDLILSLDTIEHVLNPYIVLDELYRISKSDGFFIISVPNYGYIKHVVKLFMGRQPITGGIDSVERWRTGGWDGWHLHTFTRESLNALLRDCGWEPVLWTGYGDRGKRFGLEILRRRFPAIWSGALTVVCRRMA
jgi:SAM-dependent methyltransferase